MYVIDRDGAGRQPPTLTPGNMHVLDFSIDQSRSTAAILIENPTHVAEIFVSSIAAPGELRQLTTFNDALFDELNWQHLNTCLIAALKVGRWMVGFSSHKTLMQAKSIR